MAFRRGSISTRIFTRRSSVVTWINRRPVLVAKIGDGVFAMDAVYAH